MLFHLHKSATLRLLSCQLLYVLKFIRYQFMK